MTVGFVLDGVVALLLLAAIAGCVLLNRRLETLRAAQADLNESIAGFGEATRRAEAGVAELKRATEDAGRGLSERLLEARAVSDELALLTGALRRQARRLDKAPTCPAAEPAGGESANVAQLSRRRG